jgi:RNA polymerase-binding transcription factor DksA
MAVKKVRREKRRQAARPIIKGGQKPLRHQQQKGNRLKETAGKAVRAAKKAKKDHNASCSRIIRCRIAHITGRWNETAAEKLLLKKERGRKALRPRWASWSGEDRRSIRQWTAPTSQLDMDQASITHQMKYEQYKDIADAFRKLQNNTYGLCEECGEEIDIKRLAVNPLARYCVACKTKKEQLENIQKEETRFKE